MTLFIALSSLAFAPCTFATPITIDSFDNPNPGAAFFVPGLSPWGDGNPYIRQDPPNPGDPDTPGILGGQRDVLVAVHGQPLPISAAGIIGYQTVYEAGLLQIATFGDPGAYVIAQYDGRDEEPDLDPGLPGDPLLELQDEEDLGPVDLTDGATNNAFKLRFRSVDAGDASKLAMSITVVGGGQSTTVQQEILEDPKSFDYYVPFSAFTPSAPISSADSITFKFNALEPPSLPMSNVDFELDYIMAVPEPSALALVLGLGAFLLAAGAWRRKKR